MEQFLFGLGLLAGYWAWQAWQRTALDVCRDRLFDIRDEARRYFISRNIPLDDKVYVALRDLLNGHIRYAKKMTFPRFISMTFAMFKHQDVMLNMRAEIDFRLQTSDADLADYIVSVRKLSSEAMVKYIGETSAFIIFCVIICLPIYGLVKGIGLTVLTLREQNRIMVDSVSAGCLVMYKSLITVFRPIPLTLVGIVMAFPARAGMPNADINSAEMLEEYSYEASLVR